MKNKSICQSCAMPMNRKSEKLYGTELGGTKSSKYCFLCYKEGEFTQKDITAEFMQYQVVGILVKKFYIPGFVATMAARSIPKLERWKV